MTSTTKTNLPKKASDKKQKNVYLWIGAGVLLVVAAGGTVLYLKKKKKKEERAAMSKAYGRPSASSGSSPGRRTFSCRNTGYPMKFGTCGEHVKVLQKILQSRGANLGRGGIDGKFGEMTEKAALSKLGKSTFSATDITGFSNALKFVG